MHDAIEILWGETTASHAHLYLRAMNSCSMSNAEQAMSLTGTLIGPESLYAKTLPARLKLQPGKPGSDLLAELVVPDPCFWTADLPLLYRLNLQLQVAACETKEISQLVGIRHWGIDRTSLRLTGRRIVLRGLDLGTRKITREELSMAHAMQLTLLVHQPDDAYCEMASQVGVALMADLRGISEVSSVSHELARISRWPSVLVAVIDPQQAAAVNWRPANLPIFQSMDLATPRESPRDGEIAHWADGILVETGASYENLDWLTTVDKPVLVIRPAKQKLELTEVRQACDRLQADLAPQLDLAGYLVGE